MQKPRVLFLVDHKHRDLPALTLIGCHLEQAGIETLHVAIGDEARLVERFDPDCIVLPKPVYDLERVLRWRADGRMLAVIETEGNPQDITFELRIRVAPDAYFFWNQRMAERYRRQLDGRTDIRVLGFMRSDFLHPRLGGVFPSREAILARYGLSPRRRTLTIATSAQDSHFSEERVRQKRRRRSRSFSKTADYLEIVANMRELRDRTVDALTRLTARFPDLNVALKPHPHENAVFWSDVIQSLGRSNVALVVGEPINHLLRVSDLHVAFNVCTTTVEALLGGVPTVELQTDRSPRLYAERHLDLPTYRVHTFEALEAAIAAETAAAPARAHLLEPHQRKLDEYVAEFFHVYDGRRCEEYARALAAAIQARRGARRSSLTLSQRLLHAALSARNRAARVLSRQGQLISQVNAPTAGGTRAVRDIKGVLVDEEFGLYDNRMRIGDDAAWRERFAAAGLIQQSPAVRQS